MSKPRYSIARIVQLYVRENLSLRRVAEAVGISGRTVELALDKAGVERRSRTCTQFCWCGQPAEKRTVRQGGRKPLLYGTLCRKHRLEHNNALQRARRAR